MAPPLSAGNLTTKSQEDNGLSNAPQLTLPKGGGAIRGIGEKFAANPVTGTGSMTIPIFASPGRSGFGPQLSLSYNSGSGNSPFGFGWSLRLPEIQRKTDKGLPQYNDDEESDVFILSDAEDLMPELAYSAGEWTRDSTKRTVYGTPYTIHRYRPRVEGIFARIERWTNVTDSGDTFWRSISKDNVTTWYGRNANSRIADPADPRRIFNWMICESYDDKGNVVSYEYKYEDSIGVDVSQASERNRTDTIRSANRYIKNVFYGNRKPYFPDLTGTASTPLPRNWCFKLVFDYGEHDQQNPVPQDTLQPWTCRMDPFSNRRPTFEVRTYRLCQRVLMFHNFPQETNVGSDCLVRSTDFVYFVRPADRVKAPYSYLVSVTQTGFNRNSATGYVSQSLPPVEFQYTEAEIDETVREIGRESLEDAPYGLDGTKYRWVDLDGEGLSGILTEQGESWFYKPNLSPVNQQVSDGKRLTLPRFARVQLVDRQPSLANLSDGRQQLMDLSGDGQLDIVDFEEPAPGFFERTENANWAPHRAFKSLPVLDWHDPNLRFIDLTGDGFPDLLISEDDAFWWHTSLSIEGFGPAQRVPQSPDEERGPQLLFADSTESIFLADMSGDGLTDLVRIRVGEVCYWPNLGYGRFGSKVTMDHAPTFDRPDLFDSRQIRLADIDGSGTIDIIYLASDSVHLYFNQSGNSWGAKRALNHFPSVESISSATALDLLGNGTACLVWSSPLLGNVYSPMRYIDLMGGKKPHLLVHTANNLGAETHIQYAPSTKFYVADKLAGTPWVTRLPFPVHVVEQVESYDYISRNRFVTRYSYHHGYYDGVEREFRGFGRVDQYDTEDFATLSDSNNFPQPANQDQASNVPPTLTKTWFHTGAFFEESVISKHFEREYYSERDSSDPVSDMTQDQVEAMVLEDTVLPTTVFLCDGSHLPYNFSGEEMREACRALRGAVLRQEIYALDGTDESARPYGASERNYTIEVLQPRGQNQFGVFLVHPRESLDFHYERKLFKVVGKALADQNTPPPDAENACDPRVSHAMTLAIDVFGNVLKSVAIGYGRRYHDPALTAEDQSKQAALLSTYAENSYTNSIDLLDSYRTPLPAQARSYELLQLEPAVDVPGITNLFRWDEMRGIIMAASNGSHDIPFGNPNPAGLNPDQPYRRLIASAQVRYRPDDMGAAAGDIHALLSKGQVESLALPGCSFRLAFTPELVKQIYERNGAALLPSSNDVLLSAGPDGGAYVDLDGDGNSWIRSGRVFYEPLFGLPSPQDEESQATKHFFLPATFEDPFFHHTSVHYDRYDLLVAQTTDAVGNVTIATSDYRVLAPSLLTDPNGNRAAVSFDTLGLVAGTAVMGKTTENLGDTLANFSPDLTRQQINDFYAAADPNTLAGSLLGSATTRIVYDLQRFVNTQTTDPEEPTSWQPTFAATIARETHVSDLSPDQPTKVQISFSYSDGYGREIQNKIQAEPGPVVSGGPTLNPRWVGSGWTIFNNKGKPVRQYEPFFSQLPLGHQFEFGVHVGVSPILCYDPLERVIATIHPNNTYEKIVFDPWHQQTFDVNDNVLQTDPTTDPDVGSYFSRLPSSDYSPSWYALRTDPAYAVQAANLWPDPTIRAEEAEAAVRSAAHANTPSMAYFDSLGRAYLTVADNAAYGKYPTRVELDIQGNQRSVTDPIGRKVITYDYDILGNRLHQSSMEAGERWILNDVAGKPIRSWDTRGHNFRTEYDPLRRPISLYVHGTDPGKSDPRTLNREVLFQKTEYGEGQPDDQALNLRTRTFRLSASASVVTSMGHNAVTNQDEAYDFKGNLLRSTRQFVADYKGLASWDSTLALLPDIFTSSGEYDALNRPVSVTTPDTSTVHLTYNEANFLETLNINLLGVATPAPFITNIDYNAKGQRTLIEYGNSVRTDYAYDPDTFRLTQLTTTRLGFPVGQQTVQDLFYSYDPIGNITHIQDDADNQDVVFFRNQRVEPSNDYTYDAIYRLIQATGREQLGLGANGNKLSPTASSYNDVPRVLLHPSPTDGNAMGTYTEKYRYDAVGNFLQMVHNGSQPSTPGWTRSYSYTEPSLLEPGKVNNRLSLTTISGSQPLKEPYTHDAHGNMTSMPQLQAMQWNFKDDLLMTQRQTVSSSDSDGIQHQGERTYYVYDGTGQRARKVTESAAGIKIKERFYVGGYEVYREYHSNRVVSLERQSLHVMDDKQRIALVETRSRGDDGSPAQLQRYQLSNHLGSACLELDEQAKLISYEEYCPYGNTSYQGGRSLIEVKLKRYRYTGMERDEESGLNYHTARYYATWLGRWTSVDPKREKFLSWSPYVYVLDKPSVFLDASGQSPQEIVLRRLTKETAERIKNISGELDELSVSLRNLNQRAEQLRGQGLSQEQIERRLGKEYKELEGTRDLLLSEAAGERRAASSLLKDIQELETKLGKTIPLDVELGGSLKEVLQQSAATLRQSVSKAESLRFSVPHPPKPPDPPKPDPPEKKGELPKAQVVERKEPGEGFFEKVKKWFGLGREAESAVKSPEAMNTLGKLLETGGLLLKGGGKLVSKALPIVGAGICITEGVEHLSEGRYARAAVDFVEAIPLLGDVVLGIDLAVTFFPDSGPKSNPVFEIPVDEAGHACTTGGCWGDPTMP